MQGPHQVYATIPMSPICISHLDPNATRQRHATPVARVPVLIPAVHPLLPASPAPPPTRSPFFTWWLPNGGGVHVTVTDGLYRELIPLIDSVALSVEYMDQHLDKVRVC